MEVQIQDGSSRYSNTDSQFSSRWARVTAALALVFSSLTLTARPSEAAVPHVSMFSPYFRPSQWTMESCSISSGVGFDNLHPDPVYHFFGAAHVECPEYRSVAVTVRQFRSVNGVVEEVGSPGSFSGTTTKVFLPTGPACRTPQGTAWFSTGVSVTIGASTSQWLYSPWLEATGGCRA